MANNKPTTGKRCFIQFKDKGSRIAGKVGKFERKLKFGAGKERSTR
jgi:hypothetical protein